MLVCDVDKDKSDNKPHVWHCEPGGEADYKDNTNIKVDG
jgi:hypothetical protein